MTNILLVDDEETLREALGFGLESEGHQVITKNNGQDAIGWLIGHAHPDLIITDLKMPRLNGYELIEFIQLECPRVPVITISGTPERLGERPTIVKHHLQKPFDIFTLLETVNTCLNQAAPAAWAQPSVN